MTEIGKDCIVTLDGDDGHLVRRIQLGSNGKVTLYTVDTGQVTVLNMGNARRITMGTWTKTVNHGLPSERERKFFTVTVHWDANDTWTTSCWEELFAKRLSTALMVQLGA